MHKLHIVLLSLFNIYKQRYYLNVHIGFNNIIVTPSNYRLVEFGVLLNTMRRCPITLFIYVIDISVSTYTVIPLSYSFSEIFYCRFCFFKFFISTNRFPSKTTWPPTSAVFGVGTKICKIYILKHYLHIVITCYIL